MDRKQIIYDIERCICHVPDACRDCSKYDPDDGNLDCMEKLLKDAMDALKEQEPVKSNMNYYGRDDLQCVFCNEQKDHLKKCKYCENGVKWE